MMTHPPHEMPWFLTNPLYIVLFFICWWAFATYVISFLTGWHSLAGKFRLQAPFTGEKWSFRTAHMRFFTHYSNCLTLGANSSGLYMSVFPIFRIGHPPLLTPWSEITVIRDPAPIFFFFQRKKLLLGREDPIPLYITTQLAENLRQAAGPAWPVESLGT